MVVRGRCRLLSGRRRRTLSRVPEGPDVCRDKVGSRTEQGSTGTRNLSPRDLVEEVVGRRRLRGEGRGRERTRSEEEVQGNEPPGRISGGEEGRWGRRYGVGPKTLGGRGESRSRRKNRPDSPSR